jgi:hypothetical protein
MRMPWQRCLDWIPRRDACSIRIKRQHPSIWEQHYPAENRQDRLSSHHSRNKAHVWLPSKAEYFLVRPHLWLQPHCWAAIEYSLSRGCRPHECTKRGLTKNTVSLKISFVLSIVRFQTLYS